MKELSYRVSNYYGLPYNGNMMFEFISGRFQFKFRDRIAAAEILGDSLKSRIKRNEQKATVVLGIPRGGIITAELLATSRTFVEKNMYYRTDYLMLRIIANFYTAALSE